MHDAIESSKSLPVNKIIENYMATFGHNIKTASL
jgi:hypothetical protein